MTAQIADRYAYEGKEYSIVAFSEQPPFLPQLYGLEPQRESTACWSGYWCTYAVKDGCLVLRKLHMHNSSGNFPPLNGREATFRRFENDPPVWYEENTSADYENVELFLPYTGRILLGNDFLPEFYRHMGYQGYWAYRELLELTFEEGKLVHTKDRSPDAAARREALKAGKEIDVMAMLKNRDYPGEGDQLLF